VNGRLSSRTVPQEQDAPRPRRVEDGCIGVRRPGGVDADHQQLTDLLARLILATTAARSGCVGWDCVGTPDGVLVGVPLGVVLGEVLADDGLFAPVGLGRTDPVLVPGATAGACVQDTSVMAPAATNANRASG
jgi:hypothetical protein